MKHLIVGNNFISEIPESISLLQEIESIDLSNNYLRELPKKIHKLESLKRLDLSGNHISGKKIEKLRKKMKNCDIIFE